MKRREVCSLRTSPCALSTGKLRLERKPRLSTPEFSVGAILNDIKPTQLSLTLFDWATSSNLKSVHVVVMEALSMVITPTIRSRLKSSGFVALATL